ncbi:MAG: hypothetical protein DMF64_19105 [Acidobacteria bacterium]|nr:MAG: hypothetical protein DMF64_19105 [Acidobacteriota bacterium]
MPRAHEELIKQLLAELTPDETNNGVVYVTAQPIAAGTEIKLPRLTINVEADSLLAFVDREPAANWTHSCRYLLINCATGATRSFEAQLPPFGQQAQTGAWRVAYKAPAVPDALLAVPQ